MHMWLLLLVGGLRGAMSQQAFGFNRNVIGNSNTAGRPAPGVVATTLTRNFALVSDIYLGTPPQRLTCLLDTGSSDLWVPSMRCQTCRSPNLFNVDASQTFSPQMDYGRPVETSITYGSGAIKGYYVHDAFSFGSAQVSDQAIIIVEDADLPATKSWDGICGLGWQALSKVDRPFYLRLQEQGIPAIFSFVPNQGANAGAYVRAGEQAQQDQMQPGTLVWLPAETMGNGFDSDARGFWIVSGGVAITRPEPVPVRFLVDTGTNQVLLVPRDVYYDFMSSLLPDQLFDQLCGSDGEQDNLVVCDCSILSGNLLPLRLNLGGRDFSLDMRHLFRTVGSSDGSTLCMLQIQPNGMMGGQGTISAGDLVGQLLGGLFGRRLQYGQDPTEDIWMIGGVFLEHFVCMFDFDNARIGFAEPSGGVQPLSPQRKFELEQAAAASLAAAGPAARHLLPVSGVVLCWLAVAVASMLVGGGVQRWYRRGEFRPTREEDEGELCEVSDSLPDGI